MFSYGNTRPHWIALGPIKVAYEVRQFIKTGQWEGEDERGKSPVHSNLKVTFFFSQDDTPE